MNLTPQPRHRLEIGELTNATIILVGCGGTGSFAALHLARLAYEVRRAGGPDLNLIFVDPDRVEQKNLGRQNFCEAEIGLPKAIALASRYNLAFGLEIRAAVKRFGEADLVSQWNKAHWRGHGQLLLIVGCVDSPAARAEIDAAIRAGSWAKQRDIFWLDAGNDEHSGQVLLGNCTKIEIDPTLGCLALPLPSIQEPEGLLPASKPAVNQNLSCAELLALNVQSLMINQAIAGWIGVYASRLILSHDLEIYQTWINLKDGVVRSKPITGEAAVVVATPAPVEAEGPRLRGVVPDLFGGAVGYCPECGEPIFEGRDTIHEEIGEDDIVFCPACNWRQYADEWQAQREEADGQARDEMIVGVRARRDEVARRGQAEAEALGLVEVA